MIVTTHSIAACPVTRGLGRSQSDIWIAHEVSAGPANGKLVVRNAQLMLSGDLARPIRDADAITAGLTKDQRKDKDGLR